MTGQATQTDTLLSPMKPREFDFCETPKKDTFSLQNNLMLNSLFADRHGASLPAWRQHSLALQGFQGWLKDGGGGDGDVCGGGGGRGSGGGSYPVSMTCIF